MADIARERLLRDYPGKFASPRKLPRNWQVSFDFKHLVEKSGWMFDKQRLNCYSLSRARYFERVWGQQGCRRWQVRDRPSIVYSWYHEFREARSPRRHAICGRQIELRSVLPHRHFRQGRLKTNHQRLQSRTAKVSCRHYSDDVIFIFVSKSMLFLIKLLL